MTHSPDTQLGEAPQRILIVDDDQKLCRLLSDYLEPLGYSVVAVHDGLAGAARAVAEPWSAMILDLMLPGCDGLEVLRRVRAAPSRVPILVLTGRGDETDRIVGLECGADDYLPKTFSRRELLARLRAVTRRDAWSAGVAAAAPAPREHGAQDGALQIGPLRILPSARRAELRGTSLALTPVEFNLLLSLARARGRVRSRDQLLEEIRDRNYEIFDRSIDVHISALRRKLGDDARQPRFIRTCRSAGYMLQDPDSP